MNLNSYTAVMSSKDCIDVDESKVKITQPDCGKTNGSIKGLIITGATNYIWKDDKGQVVGNQIDLLNVNSGVYQLTATNPNCTKTTSLFTVPTAAVLPNYDVFGINAACDENNGSLHIKLNNLRPPKAIRWTNAQGTTIGTDLDVTGLDVGDYTLYLTNDAGCEVLYKTATLRRILNIKVNFDLVSIKNDVCDQGLGTIKGIKITDGLGPFFFKWMNEKGDIVGNTQDLINVPAGKYTVKITDNCGRAEFTQDFAVLNANVGMLAPSISDTKLCSSAPLIIAVNNPKEGIYRFYESASSNAPLYEGPNPFYESKISEDTNYYVSYGLGTCESPRTKIEITLGINSNTIANSFSPNGDGINDNWNLTWLSYYKKAVVKVFNRDGQLVYDYQRDKIMFDGTSNGKDLPIGAYYYIINPGEGCNQITGTLTIIR